MYSQEGICSALVVLNPSSGSIILTNYSRGHIGNKFVHTLVEYSFCLMQQDSFLLLAQQYTTFRILSGREADPSSCLFAAVLGKGVLMSSLSLFVWDVGAALVLR
jgi:hypothetical protein